jgi:hypothetical protein
VEPEIVCTLSLASLKEHPTFTALSYMWGDASNTVPITVDGRKISVTSNLAYALLDIYPLLFKGDIPPDRHGTGRIWADALCIDQGNTEEKNHQLRLMKKIYSTAETVFSWIGRCDNEALPESLAFDAFNLIYRETSALGADSGSID